MNVADRCNLYVHRENAAWGEKRKRLPVTLVTGFLGAGKTTLLRFVLSNKENLRIAAAVNDFAAVNIDAQLVAKESPADGSGRGNIVALTNGCLCCSIAKDFRSAVWTLMQECDQGNVDYLVIETSGVSDPLSSIRALEEDFGKMYRVRLDSVVTVVDIDYFLTLTKKDGSLPVAFQSQLKYADVVLLNKRDLASAEELAAAETGVRQLAGPGVIVRTSKFCAVPLNWVLDVNPATTGPQLVSHEATRAAYALPDSGGKLRSTESIEAAQKGENQGHMEEDHFGSMVVESSSPLMLSRFQDLLGSKCMENVYRAKGNVFFAELPHHRYMFHWSGRQRFELAMESAVGAASVQLVILGRHLPEQEIRQCLEPPSTIPTSLLPGLLEQAHALVSSDCRFDVIARDDLASIVIFRLTGYREFSITLSEATTIHGINIDRMNREFVEAVNCCSGSTLLTGITHQDGQAALCYALGGDVTLDAVWPTILKEADKIIAMFFHAVRGCKCGW
eukprot:scpid41221/ scgid16816/ Putative metal chaperone YciC